MSSATAITAMRHRRVAATQSTERRIVLAKLVRHTWVGQNQLSFAQATIAGRDVDAEKVKPPRAKLIPDALYDPINAALRRYEQALARYALPFPWLRELGLQAVAADNMPALMAEFALAEQDLNRAVDALVDAYQDRVVAPARGTFVELLGRRAFIAEHSVDPTDNDAEEVARLGNEAFEDEFHGGGNGAILPREAAAVRGRYGVVFREVPIDLAQLAPEELGLAADEMADAPRTTLAAELLKAASALVDRRLASNRLNAAVQAAELCRNWPDLFDEHVLARIGDVERQLSGLISRGQARLSTESLADVWPEGERKALSVAIAELASDLNKPDIVQHARGAVRRAFRVTE